MLVSSPRYVNGFWLLCRFQYCEYKSAAILYSFHNHIATAAVTESEQYSGPVFQGCITSFSKEHLLPLTRHASRQSESVISVYWPRKGRPLRVPLPRRPRRSPSPTQPSAASRPVDGNTPASFVALCLSRGSAELFDALCAELNGYKNVSHIVYFSFLSDGTNVMNASLDKFYIIYVHKCIFTVMC